MTIEMRLLGRFVVLRDGEEIPPGAFRQRLVRTLIRVLAARRGQFVSREGLSEALWPRRPPADPGANLRVLVALARHGLGDPGLLVTGPNGYCLASGSACIVDAEAFLAAARSAREAAESGGAAGALPAYRAALALWGGEPLAEDAYEDWAQGHRTALRLAHLEVLEEGAAAALAARQLGEAAALAHQATVAEPFRERAHLLLAEATAASGDAGGALAVLDAFRRRSAEELGLDPSPAAEELQRRILQAEVPVHRVSPPVHPPVQGSTQIGFVGRAGPLAAISERVRRGQGFVAEVTGSPGFGKSWLLREIARAGGVPVIAARAFLPDGEEAWSLARSLLREALALDVGFAASIPARAAGALVEILPELEEIRPSSPEVANAESRRALALEGAYRLLESACAGGALLLVDDLQWADATSLALLSQILRRLPGARAVFAYQPEEVQPGGPAARLLDEIAGLGSEVVPMDLGPLTDEDLAELLDGEELLRAAGEETDRSPGAVSELIRELAADGSASRQPDGRWRATGLEGRTRAVAAARAGKLRSLQARIQRQPVERRHTLALLALVGRQAPARLVSMAKGIDQRPVLVELEALCQEGLVELGDEGWASGPGPVGDAVAACVGRPTIGRLHAMLAEALAACGAEPAECARHLRAAGDLDAAADAFAAAAHRCLTSYATAEAERLAHEGLAARPRPPTRARLLDVRAEARARLGDLKGAEDDLRPLLDETPAGPHKARLTVRMARLVADTGDLGQAHDLIDMALVLAGKDPRARAEALVAGAILDANNYRLDRAEACIEEARSLFESAGDAEGVAGCLDAQATALLVRGRVTESIALRRQVVQLMGDSGMLLGAAVARGWLAIALIQGDRREEALQVAEEAIQLDAALGHHDIVVAQGMKALALAALGRADEALPLTEQAMDTIRRMGNRWLLSPANIVAGIVAGAAGDPDHAEASFRRALATGERAPIFSAWAASALARVLVARGRLDEAERFVDAAKQAAGFPYEARWADAELSVARGDPDAKARVAEALSLAEEGGHLQSARRLKELLDAPTPSPPA